MIGYVSCNSGAGFAAEEIKIDITLPVTSSFGIMKIGVFGEEGATDSCSGTPTVSVDSSLAGTTLTFDLLTGNPVT